MINRYSWDEGYKAFSPEKDAHQHNPYKKAIFGESNERGCWFDGWNVAREEYVAKKETKLCDNCEKHIAYCTCDPRIIPLDWEKVDYNHERSKCLGGWILRSFDRKTNNVNDHFTKINLSMVFIPDPNHQWRIE